MLVNYYDEDKNFSKEAIQENCQRLINQIFKLIPMRENNEQWEKQLETLTNELRGLTGIFYNESLYIQLFSKILGLSLSEEEVAFDFYRKTVFESISILQEIKSNA